MITGHHLCNLAAAPRICYVRMEQRAFGAISMRFASIIAFVTVLAGGISAQDLSDAQKLYGLTNYEASLKLLQSVPQKNARCGTSSGRTTS